tara:strand:- start:5360 stop:6043 length:684 start_codon:yes stop_codon:yes gene_type:complete
MKSFLKKIPGVTIVFDSLKAISVIAKYTFGVNVEHEEERADPDDPKWENDSWSNVFKRRCDYAVNVSNEKRVLDLCCGTGWTSNELSKIAVSVNAVDYSEEVIEIAKKKYPKGNLFFEKMNALDLNFSDESFDTVVSMEAIEHFSKLDGEKYLSEVVRVLKKDGVFIGSTPQVETKNPLKVLALKRIDPYHLQLYSIKMLKSVLLEYFSNVEIESQPEEWMLFKCTR